MESIAGALLVVNVGVLDAMGLTIQDSFSKQPNQKLYLDFDCNVTVLISHIHVNDNGFSKKFNVIRAFHKLKRSLKIVHGSPPSLYLICIIKFEAELHHIILILFAKILKKLHPPSSILIKDLFIIKFLII